MLDYTCNSLVMRSTAEVPLLLATMPGRRADQQAKPPASSASDVYAHFLHLFPANTIPEVTTLSRSDPPPGAMMLFSSLLLLAWLLPNASSEVSDAAPLPRQLHCGLVRLRHQVMHASQQLSEPVPQLLERGAALRLVSPALRCQLLQCCRHCLGQLWALALDDDLVDDLHRWHEGVGEGGLAAAGDLLGSSVHAWVAQGTRALDVLNFCPAWLGALIPASMPWCSGCRQAWAYHWS